MAFESPQQGIAVERVGDDRCNAELEKQVAASRIPTQTEHLVAMVKELASKGNT
jgi:hypothetical protein